VSVSGWSNVPGYDQPNCFVSSGNTNDMIQEFVEYLIRISQESYVLLLERFSDIFEQINERITNSEVYYIIDSIISFMIFVLTSPMF
jgi:hypothetical protein